MDLIIIVPVLAVTIWFGYLVLKLFKKEIMALSITSYPDEVSLVGNPVLFKIAADTGWESSGFYGVHVQVKRTSDDSNIGGVQRYIPDDNGIITVDISDILQREIADILTWPEKVDHYLIRHDNIILQFYMTATAYSGNPLSAGSTIDSDNYIALPGGVSKIQLAKWAAEGVSFYDEFIERGRFLTSAPRVKISDKSMPERLYFYNKGGLCRGKLKLHYSDNTTEEVVRGLEAGNEQFKITEALKPALIRNVEGDNVSESGSTTLLEITAVSGNEITLGNLTAKNLSDLKKLITENIDWFVQNLDDYNYSEPSYSGDYLTQDKVVSFDFENGKIELIDATGFDIGDRICLYSPWANYRFLPGQESNGILYSASKPAWRANSEASGPVWWDDINDRYILIFAGYGGTNYQLGFAYSIDLVTWIIGNSDAPIITNADDPHFSKTIHAVGNVVDNDDGTVSFLINAYDGTDRHIHLATCDRDDPTTITWGATELISATNLFGGGIAYFNNKYHLLVSTMGTPIEDRYNMHYICDTIDGVYTKLADMWTTEYNNNDSHWLEGHSTTVNPFVENGKLYAIVGGQQRYTISGIQGNRVYGFMKYDDDTGSWSALNDFEPSLIHPMYFYNIPSEDYGWAGGHTGGYPSFLKKDGKCFIFFGFLYTTNTYQIGAMELVNNKPTVHELINSYFDIQLYSEKDIEKIEVWMEADINGTNFKRISEIRELVIDKASYDDIRYFLFENNFGVWDSFRTVGGVSEGARIDKDQVTGILDYGFFLTDRQLKKLTVSEFMEFVTHTGWNDKTYLNYLRQAFSSEKTFIVQNSDLLPVLFDNDNIESISSESNLAGFPLKYIMGYPDRYQAGSSGLIDIDSIAMDWRDMHINNQAKIMTICNLGFGFVFAGGYGDGKIFKSTDWGRTWEHVATLVPGSGNAYVSHIFNTGKDLIALLVDINSPTAGGQIWKSTDLGENWANKYSQLSTYLTKGINVGGGVLLAGSIAETGDNIGVVRSVDYGENWSYLSLSVEGVYSNYTPTSFVLDNNDDILCVLAGMILKSNDAGLSWVLLGEHNVWNLLKVGKRIYGTKVSSIAYSDDNGLTWTAKASLGNTVHDISFVPGFGFIVIKMIDSSTYQICISRDNGSNWYFHTENQWGTTWVVKHIGNNILLAGNGEGDLHRSIPNLI